MRFGDARIGLPVWVLPDGEATEWVNSVPQTGYLGVVVGVQMPGLKVAASRGPAVPVQAQGVGAEYLQSALTFPVVVNSTIGIIVGGYANGEIAIHEYYEDDAGVYGSLLMSRSLDEVVPATLRDLYQIGRYNAWRKDLLQRLNLKVK